MTESIYKEYQNKYYNPNDNDKKPGDNDNWKSIQEGFHRIGSTQLETSEGLTLGKGTADETSVSAAELEEIKNPTQLETSGGLTLGKGTVDETSVTAAELEEIKNSVSLVDMFRIKVSAGGNITLQPGATQTFNLLTNSEIRNRIPANANGTYYLCGLPCARGVYSNYEGGYIAYSPIRIRWTLRNIPSNNDILVIDSGNLIDAFADVYVEAEFSNTSSAAATIPPYMFYFICVRA